MIIESGSDLILKITDERGNGIRVNNKASFFIRVFTTDKSQYLEYGKSDVVERNDYDTICISAKDLIALESGVIAYTYGWGMNDTNFDDDGEYNRLKTIYTNFYFKNNGESSGTENVGTIQQIKNSIDKINDRLNAHTVTVKDNTLIITT